MEYHIDGYTREELLGNKPTRTSIDHISTTMTNKDFLGRIIKEKEADHYFVTITVLGEVVSRVQLMPENTTIISNVEFDKQITSFDWDSLITRHHTEAYELAVQKFEEIYRKAKKK